MDDRPSVSLMSRVEVFDDVLRNIVALFMTTVSSRPSRGAVTVVRLLGGEPITIYKRHCKIDIYIYIFS